MRRREGARVPVRLVTFEAGDWPGDSAQESFGLWLEARRAWADEHGWSGPDEEPDGLDAAAQTPDEPWDTDAI